MARYMWSLLRILRRDISASMHVIFEVLDFIAKLASLVPKPRVNLTRYVRIVHDTHPLRGPAKAVQIHS